MTHLNDIGTRPLFTKALKVQEQVKGNGIILKGCSARPLHQEGQACSEETLCRAGQTGTLPGGLHLAQISFQ